VTTRPHSTILDLIEHQAAACPDAIAIEDTGTLAVSYSDLAATVHRLRRSLAACGVRPGTRVAIWMRMATSS
jgi:acyl-CoA synthetase (AMP-forming)/AMP-acid ligase II